MRPQRVTKKRVLQSKLLKMQVAYRKHIWETDAKSCIQTKLILSFLLEHTFDEFDVGRCKADEVFAHR